MRFVALTQFFSGETLFVNPQMVKAVWASADPDNSYISLGGDVTFTVIGTKEEVVAILEGVQA